MSLRVTCSSSRRCTFIHIFPHWQLQHDVRTSVLLKIHSNDIPVYWITATRRWVEEAEEENIVSRIQKCHTWYIFNNKNKMVTPIVKRMVQASIKINYFFFQNCLYRAMEISPRGNILVTLSVVSLCQISHYANFQQCQTWGLKLFFFFFHF